MVTDSMSRLVHGYAVPVSTDCYAFEISHNISMLSVPVEVLVVSLGMSC